MANLNKVMLIGRLTRDPEFRTFTTGGRVAKFGFAVTNRKKNAQTGEWEDDPMFIDCEAFNRGDYGKNADLIERFGLHKGSQIFIEGRLILDRWDDKTTGEKRSKHKVVVDNFQLLDRREDGGGQVGGGAPARSSSGAPRQQSAPAYDEGPADEPVSGGDGGEIPF